jgi:membrane protein implicated in regulation of membrane protease activity
LPVALTGDEWVVLLSAIVPAILAVVVVWVFWRWAKRDEAREKAEAAARQQVEAAARRDEP